MTSSDCFSSPVYEKQQNPYNLKSLIFLLKNWLKGFIDYQIRCQSPFIWSTNCCSSRKQYGRFHYQLARLMSGEKNEENYIPPQGSAPLILIYGAFFFRINSYFIVGRQDNTFMIVSSICKMDWQGFVPLPQSLVKYIHLMQFYTQNFSKIMFQNGSEIIKE